MTPLERRYRRWLRAYPPAYRDEREEELIGVLLDRAKPGQHHPTVVEVVDLVRAGFTAHLRRPVMPTALPPWTAAANLVAILLTLLLGVDALVGGLAMVHANADQLRTLLADISFVPGWYAPWLWTLAAALLVIGRPRPAMAAAWVAVGSQLASILWLLRERGTSIAYSMALGFAVATLAAVILSRPAAVGRSVVALGRSRVVVSTVAMGTLVAAGAFRWLPLGGPRFDATMLALVVVVGAFCLVPRSGELRRRDPVRRRVALMLGTLVLFGIGNSSHTVVDVPLLTRPDLDPAVTLLIAVVVPVAVIGVGALAALVFRRLSDGPARRGF